MFTCENHPDREAKWLRDSWIMSGTPAPICNECKKNYEELRLDKALKVRLIFSETKDERHGIHTD